MFPLRRCLCLHATIKCTRIFPVARSKDELVSSWALYEQTKLQISIQHRHSSRLVVIDKHDGFRTPSGIFVKPGDSVELGAGTFLRVKKVLYNDFHNRHWIVGWRFVRNRETSGLPRKDPNEVYWVVHLTKNNPLPAAEQTLVKVDGSQILRKITMTMVNTTYPDDRKGTGAHLGSPGDSALSCRWKHVVVTKIEKLNAPLDAFKIPAAEIEEASFQPLRSEECDPGLNNRTDDENLRQSWLGVKERGVIHIESEKSISLELAVEALSIDSNNRKKRVPVAYTLADVCCGAGGASRGAKMAGLELRWALDEDGPACMTYRLNFPDVRLYQKQIQDVARMPFKDLRIDIMHISPPCQAFSGANTSPNLEKDIANIAANMEIGNCLDKARPRIATLEQTSWLMSLGYVGGRHSKHWSNLIEQFTSRGYSIAWKIMDLAELGLPQSRRRLVMIASCPGEPLPQFPKPALARDPGNGGLKGFTTVKDAIKNIPHNWFDHEIPPNSSNPREPYDENGVLPEIVMTDRYKNTHPSGVRAFSLRELACLQGFPLEHKFFRTTRVKDTMKQIGNAYPPTMAAVLFESMKEQLLIQDRLKPR